MKQRIYAGLNEDLKRGMTPTAKIVLDAKVFGLIEDEEDCKGWNVPGIQALYDKVAKAWEPYGCLPSRLPDDLRRRHTQFFDAAIERAKSEGWDPERDLAE